LSIQNQCKIYKFPAKLWVHYFTIENDSKNFHLRIYKSYPITKTKIRIKFI
jgi:hypothetical protein